MKNDEITVLKFHAAGHAVVGVRLGFKVKRVALSGGHQPECGVQTPELDANGFAPSIPTEARQTLAIPIIAVYAAGYVAEEKQFKVRREDWFNIDREMMERYAVRAVVAEGEPSADKNRSSDAAWPGWPAVDEIVKAGENLAKSVLGNDWKAVTRIVGQLRTERAVVFGPVIEKLVKQDDGGRPA